MKLCRDTSSVQAIKWLSGCLGILILTTAFAMGNKMQDQIHESLYSTPFPLANGGEKIDVLVRVTKAGGHYFSLVFVENGTFSNEQKNKLREVAIEGYEPHTSYLFKFRFRLDSADDQTMVHIDQVVSHTLPAFSASPTKDVIWHARQISFPRLEPGVYRVQIENLKPCPEIAWIETLFYFVRDGRK